MDNFKNCYAREFLYKRGHSIKAGGSRILSYVGPLYDVPKVNNRLVMGDRLIDVKKIVNITTIEELRRHKLILVSEAPKQKFFPRQMQFFRLAYPNPAVPSLTKMPSDHRVEWSPESNAYRVIGKNAGFKGMGRWFRKHESHDGRKNESELDYKMRLVREKMMRLGFESSEENEIIDIPDDLIAAMISDEGKIVCIQDELAEPVIGIAGQRRNGNSWLGHRLCDSAFYKWGKRIFIANDKLSECGTWCRIWENDEFGLQVQNELRQIGEPSVPLPTVYLKLKYSMSRLFGDLTKVAQYVSIPFEDMIRQYEAFFEGNKRLELKNTLTFFRGAALREDGSLHPGLHMDRILCFKDFEMWVLDQFVGSIDQDEMKKNQNQNVTMTNKLLSVFKDLWNHNIMDVSNRVPSKWEVFDRDGKSLGEHYPWNACLLAGLVPVMQNHEIADQPYFQQWQRFVMKSVMEFQKHDPVAQREKFSVWIWNDEILGIAGKRKKQVVADAMDELIRESGPYRIGVIWRAQYYNAVPDSTIQNTGYLFCSQQVSKSAKAICHDKGLSKEWEVMLTKLKPFEFILIANGRKIVTYDPANGKREELTDNYPIKGRILPPMSQHKAPK